MIKASEDDRILAELFKILKNAAAIVLLGRKAMTNLDIVLKVETSLCRKRSIQSKLGFFQ